MRKGSIIKWGRRTFVVIQKIKGTKFIVERLKVRVKDNIVSMTKTGELFECDILIKNKKA